MFIDTTEKETILKPLQVIIGIVERKQTLPILSNVLIEKAADRVNFTASDLDVQITTSVRDISLGEAQSSITVGGKKMLDILRVLPDQSKVSVETRDNKAIIKCNKSRFSLQTLPAQDFPKLNDHLENARKIVLTQVKLKRLLESVQYAMAQQDVRYYLNGVLLIVEKASLKAVATDGHRLAYSEDAIDGNHQKIESILPRKTISELCKLLADSEDPVEMEFAPQQVRITFSDVVLITKVIEGKFPDYERVIPKYTNNLVIDRMLIQQALQRAAILSNEKFRGVRFVLTEKNLSIISCNSEQEEAQEELETEYHGDALDIGFNINYLLDGLNNIKNESVALSFGDPNSSILITNPANKDFRYVVMPMRI